RRPRADQAARQPRRREIAGVPPGVDDPPADVCRRTAQGGRHARNDPPQRRHRAHRRHHRRSRSGARGDGHDREAAGSGVMITSLESPVSVPEVDHARRRRKGPPPRRDSDPESLHIGLVNNMPDPALDATERQFRALLAAASDGRPVRLTLYTLPEVPRTAFGRQQIAKYSTLDDLWNSQHDGLIVTGTEPQAADLRDEPFWGSLTRVLEWAEQHTHSTILSCLAAHAGILHIDGIARHPLGDK